MLLFASVFRASAGYLCLPAVPSPVKKRKEEKKKISDCKRTNSNGIRR